MRRLRQIATCFCILLGLFLTSCYSQTSPEMSHNAVTGEQRAVSDLISDLRSSSVRKSTSAFIMLFAVGDRAIPSLLTAGNDRTAMSWIIPPVLPGQSYVPLVSDAQGHTTSYRPTVGVVCLYLVEAIHQGRLIHGDCIIVERGEPTWDAIKKAGEHQERALRRYMTWYTNRSGSLGAKEPGVTWANSANDYRVDDVRVLSEIMSMITHNKKS